MTTTLTFLIGVDGGGTGTRVTIADANGSELARGSAGPSGLINGTDSAWAAILTAIREAFGLAKLDMPAFASMAIGLGLAGVHNRQWAQQFAEKNPGFAFLQLETDAYTTVLGAHQGRPGAIVAIGTGSVGEAIRADGSHCEVGGWGFPCGDEAGGAWIGMRAVNHVQQVLDGRMPPSEFSAAVLEHCGGNVAALFAWLASATQGSYAQIAPLVVKHAGQENNAVAEQIMIAAGQEIVKIALALDQTSELPLALCGGLAKPLEHYLPASLRSRLIAPQGDSVTGALLLIKKIIQGNHVKST